VEGGETRGGGVKSWPKGGGGRIGKGGSGKKPLVRGWSAVGVEVVEERWG